MGLLSRSLRAAALLIGALAGVWAAGPPLAAGVVQPLTLVVRPHALARGGDVDRVGRLRFLGAVSLRSGDRRFGGLSALLWAPACGRLLAVSDNGAWVILEPAEVDGRLSGIRRGWIAPLAQPGGSPPTAKRQADAEALSRAGPDTLVWFEQDHRIQRYAGVDACRPDTLVLAPQSVERLPDVRDWPANSGVEAAAEAGAAQLALAEGISGDAAGTAILVTPGQPATTLRWAPPEGLQATAMDPLDRGGADGRMLVLSRSFRPWSGGIAVVSEVQLVPGADPAGREIARLQAPLRVDNMEGLAVRAEGERRFIYLVSDDNFMAFQQTLLLKFELLPQP